ncbi:uncharacterized protein LOC144707842 [Wolffia australiana]
MSLPSRGRRRTALLGGAVVTGGALCAEMAGRAAADCAAVCCCCPCGLLSLVALVTVKLPTRLYRRFFLSRQQTQRKKMMMSDRDGGKQGSSTHKEGLVSRGQYVEQETENTPEMEVSQMEKKMWGQFTAGGFWRSPSQRAS